MQIIFNQEIKDGLEDKLTKATASIFSCPLQKIDKPSDGTLKSIASLGEGRNFDLYYLQSILASVGPNKNDDVFLPEEIWAARYTPVHKQLNYMHNEKDIIGVITDSILLDSQGAHISGEDCVGLIKDIATQAVIWTHWEDQVMTDKVDKIIASIEENKLFVSMEALFKKFDYMIVKGERGEQIDIIERTEATSFLTKYLKSFGGDGLYENNRIYRVLRDFTFSGKGIVSDPANPRSIIDESLFGSCEDCECEDDSESPEDGLEFEDLEESESCDLNFSIAETTKKVKLNKPFRTPKGPKKFSVYVKNDKGNVVKVNFGDPNMSIKRDDPERRKSFRARHNCDNPGPKWKARYWSCKFWSSTDVSKLVSTKAENIMEEELKKEIAELKEALSKANEVIAEVKSAEASKATAELEDMRAQITALKTLAADTKAKMDEMEKECAEKMSMKDKESKDKMDEAEARVIAAEAKLAEVLAEKVIAERCGQLIAENVDVDEAKALVKTFASLNDELFSQVVAIHKKSGKAEKTSETLEDAIDQAKASQKSEAKVTEVEVSDDEMTALSKSIASKLFTKKTTKGDK